MLQKQHGRKCEIIKQHFQTEPGLYPQSQIGMQKGIAGVSKDTDAHSCKQCICPASGSEKRPYGEDQHQENQGKNRGIEKYRDSPYGIDLQRIAKGWNILDSRRRGIFIRHCDHDLYRGMPFEGKHSVLDPLFIVIRVRIAHLLDQLAVHIQIICRKYLRQIQAISMLF